MSEKLPVGKTAIDLFLGSLRNCYDHVAYTVTIGTLWSLSTIIMVGAVIVLSALAPLTGGHYGTDLATIFPFMITVMVASVVTGSLIWGPLSCVLIHLAYKIQDGTANIRELWQGTRNCYGLASRVYALFFAGAVFLGVDIMVAFSFNNLMMKIAGISAMYFLIFLILMGFYIPGLIAFQENNTVPKIFRKAYLLTLDNGLLNLAVGVILTALTAIMVFLPVFYKPLGILAPFCVIYFLMFGGFLHFILSNLYHKVITRYDD